MRQSKYLLALGLALLLCSPTLGDLTEADNAYRNRSWNDAAQLYETAVKELTGDEYYRAQAQRGDALHRIEQFEQAVAVLEPVLQAAEAPASQRVRAGRWLARSLLALDEPQRAIAALQTTIGIEGISNSDYANVALQGGDVLVFALGKLDEGIAFYEKVFRTAEVVGVGSGWKSESDAAGRIAYAKALRDDTTLIWMGPWSSHVHADAAHIYWVSGENDPAGNVEVTGGKGAGDFKATTQPFTRADGFVLQTVKLTGLQPNTRYNYTVQCGDQSVTGSFKTMLEPASREPIRFTVYGDTQDRPEFHTQVAPAMAESNPDFIIHTGDLVGKGDYWPQWKAQFFDPGAPALRTASIWPAVGNHDSFMFFDPFFKGDGELYHTFTHGNVQVFFVASYRGGNEESAYRKAQLAWLEEELAKSKADWKILVTHYPMISIHPAHWVNWGQNDFRPVLEKYGVDFVLTGHEHAYRRFVPLGPEGGHPTFHITSGGGASVGGDFGHDGKGEPYQSHPTMTISVRALHYLQFDIHGNQLVLQARLRDGSVLDRLELQKTDGRYSAEILADAMTFDEALQQLRAAGTD